jgi:hypothetical protein
VKAFTKALPWLVRALGGLRALSSRSEFREERTMNKILIGMLSLALVGTGGLVAAVEGFGGDDPLPSLSLPDATTVSTTTGTTTGTTTAEATGTTTGEDISGPCDEAEQADDPRCTGGAVGDDDDNSGPGSGRDDDDDRDEDDDDDHSGRGHGGDDDRDDDNPGRGSDDD